MSSTSHLTATQTKETNVNKRHSCFNLRTTPSDGSSDLLHTLSSTTNSNYLYHVNVDSVRKQSVTVTQTLTPSITGASLNVRRKLSAISLPVPWHRRTRSPSVDKTSSDSFSKHSQQHQQKSHNPHKMSRDRLLTLDRLFSSGTHTTTGTNDDEQASPTTEFTALDDSMRSNEKPMKPIKENGYLNNSHIMTRLEKLYLHYILK
jgi:hypothetical protein